MAYHTLDDATADLQEEIRRLTAENAALSQQIIFLQSAQTSPIPPPASAAQEKSLKLLGQAITRLDKEGKIVSVSLPSEIKNSDPEQFAGQSIYDHLLPENVAVAKKAVASCFNYGRQVSYQAKISGTGGVSGEILHLLIPVHEGGEVATALQLSSGILPTQDALQTLHEGETRHARLIECFTQEYFFYSHDTNYIFTYVSPSITDILGFTPEEFLTDISTHLVEGDNQKQVERLTTLSVQGIEQEPYEVCCYHKDGRIITLEVKELPVFDEAGVVVAVKGLARDVTKRHQAASALQASEGRYRALFNNSREALFVFLINDEGPIDNFVDVNQAACELLDYEKTTLMQHRFTDFLILGANDSCVDIIEKMRETGSHMFAAHMRHHDGTEIAVEITSSLFTLEGHAASIMTVQNTSERKLLEAQLIRSERLAAVGTLAGGVAHEFNNLNVSIFGFAALALSRSDLDDELRDYLKRIQKSAARARSTAESLLAFSRPPTTVPTNGNLVRVVQEALEVVLKELKQAGVTVEARFRLVPDTVMDEDLLTQVVVNLFINAIHAMRGRRKQILSIETGGEAGRLFASFTDSGCGIPAEDLNKVFTPFFSTKGEYAQADTPQSEVTGSGLGLSVSHTIMTNHGGGIDVTSTLNVGTTFTIWLPMQASPETPKKSTKISSAMLASLVGATVIILDDEEDTRKLVSFLLVQKGYRVRGTASPREAFEWVEQYSAELVVVDLELGGESGSSFVGRIQELPEANRPAILLMSGFVQGEIESVADRYPVAGIIKKPFDLEALVLAVQKALLSHKRIVLPS